MEKQSSFQTENLKLIEQYKNQINKLHHYRCNVCNTKTKQRCKCHLAYYCCKVCQEHDYKKHKSGCRDSRLLFWVI